LLCVMGGWSKLTDFMTASAPPARLHWLLLDDREAREKEPSMMIIGCDFHPSFQQIAYVEQETHPSLPAGDPLPVLKAFTFLAARDRTKSHRTTNPDVREVLVGIADKCPVGRRALTRRPCASCARRVDHPEDD
jgi:hypothetical protein